MLKQLRNRTEIVQQRSPLNVGLKEEREVMKLNLRMMFDETMKMNDDVHWYLQQRRLKWGETGNDKCNHNQLGKDVRK